MPIFACEHIIIINDMMLGQRRANQLDNFLNGNHQSNRLVSPRNAPLSNIGNNYFSTGNQDQHKFQEKQDRNISPNRINNTRKPMISPLRSPRTQNPVRPKTRAPQTDRTREAYCSNQNHRNKKAQYIIHIEDEDMYYCGVCATQAASQGFTVNRIGSAPLRKAKNIPHIPTLQGNKRYHQLCELMEQIIKLQSEYRKKDPKAVRQQYQNQQGLLHWFYDSLSQVIERMRQDHLQDFRAEQSKSISLSQMHYDHLKIHMDDLNSAWDDIQETFEDVVEKISHEAYEDGMRTYGNTLNVFKHKLEQLDEIFEGFTIYDQRMLTAKVKGFQNQLLDLWNDEPVQQQQQQQQQFPKRIPQKVQKAVSIACSNKQNNNNYQTTLKTVHDMLPKPSSNAPHSQNQGAFRNLFPQDQGEDRLPEASPQFKAF